MYNLERGTPPTEVFPRKPKQWGANYCNLLTPSDAGMFAKHYDKRTYVHKLPLTELITAVTITGIDNTFRPKILGPVP
jgi:hypothetical protein